MAAGGTIQDYVILNPTAGHSESRVILPAKEGTTYSGTMSNIGNTGGVVCLAADLGPPDQAQLILTNDLDPITHKLDFSLVFACDSMSVGIIDQAGDGEYGNAALLTTVRYFENSDISKFPD